MVKNILSLLVSISLIVGSVVNAVPQQRGYQPSRKVTAAQQQATVQANVPVVQAITPTSTAPSTPNNPSVVQALEKIAHASEAHENNATTSDEYKEADDVDAEEATEQDQPTAQDPKTEPAQEGIVASALDGAHQAAYDMTIGKIKCYLFMKALGLGVNAITYPFHYFAGSADKKVETAKKPEPAAQKPAETSIVNTLAQSVIFDSTLTALMTYDHNSEGKNKNNQKSYTGEIMQTLKSRAGYRPEQASSTTQAVANCLTRNASYWGTSAAIAAAGAYIIASLK